MFKKWYEQHKTENIDAYFQLLRFPSISTNPDYANDLRACAQWLYEYLKKIGLEVEMWGDDKSAPTLFASDLSAGNDKETLLLYCHYDVQPIDPLKEWITPPFEPSLRDNNVFARGASDNKGQLFYTLLAIKSYLELKGSFPFNLKFIIEGEEESGSTLLTQLLEEKREQLQAEYLLIVDSGFETLSHPGLALGCRGIISLEITLQEAKCDLHSGQHGGIAYNPNRALAELLAKCYSPEGTVAIEGFYDHCVVLDEKTKQKLSFKFNKKEYQKEFGFTPIKENPLHAAWLEPTLEINGMVGGYTGPGFKTVIPAEAHAKLSCRVAAGQDPVHLLKLVETHLKKHAPKNMTLTIKNLAKCTAAVLSHPDQKIVQVMRKAYEEVFAKPIEMIMLGGSVPITDALKQVSGAESVLVGVALNTDRVHSPNEHFGLDRLELGYLTLSKAFDLLS